MQYSDYLVSCANDSKKYFDAYRSEITDDISERAKRCVRVKLRETGRRLD